MQTDRTGASAQAASASTDRRLKALGAAIAVHVLGVVVAVVAVFAVAVPAANSVNGAGNIMHARIALALIAVLAVAQAVALAVWRFSRRDARADAASVTWPWSRAGETRAYRGAAKVFAGALLAAPWAIEIACAGSLLTFMGYGNNNRATGFATVMSVVGLGLTSAVALTCVSAQLVLSASGDVETTLSWEAPADGARIPALVRQHRRATRQQAGSVITMAALVALAAAYSATGRVQLTDSLLAIAVPLVIILSVAVKAARTRNAAARAIRASGR